MDTVCALIRGVQRAQGSKCEDVVTFCTDSMWKRFNEELKSPDDIKPPFDPVLAILGEKKIYGSDVKIIPGDSLLGFSIARKHLL